MITTLDRDKFTKAKARRKLHDGWSPGLTDTAKPFLGNRLRFCSYVAITMMIFTFSGVGAAETDPTATAGDTTLTADGTYQPTTSDTTQPNPTDIFLAMDKDSDKIVSK